MFETESMLLCNRSKGQQKYIFFLQYANEKFIGGDGEDAEVSKFRMLKMLLEGF